MPARRQRSGLGLAIADDATDHQVGIVECRAVRVRERVAELAPLMDRARCLGRHMTGDPARERELAKQPAHPVDIAADRWIDLAVGALEIGVSHDPGAAVARADDIDRVEVPVPDHAIHMGVDEVQPRCGAPMTEQPRLDVLRTQRLPEQRVVEEVDLTGRQVVGRAPVAVDEARVLGTQRTVAHIGWGAIG